MYSRCSGIIRIHDNMNIIVENSRPKTQTTNYTLPAVLLHDDINIEMYLHNTMKRVSLSSIVLLL